MAVSYPPNGTQLMCTDHNVGETHVAAVWHEDAFYPLQVECPTAPSKPTLYFSLSDMMKMLDGGLFATSEDERFLILADGFLCASKGEAQET